MNTRKTRMVALVLAAGLSGAAQAALHDRGGGLIYDDVLNVTWLQDANYAKTSGYDADGLMAWGEAKTWASNLLFHDSVRAVVYDDWRLARNSPEGDPFHYGWWSASQPTGSNLLGPHSELSHMYYENLGLIGYDTTYGAWRNDFGIFGNGSNVGQNNVGLILNLQSGEYLSDAEPQPYTDNRPWTFNTNNGDHYLRLWYDPYYAWAVRDGDVAAIPEPETYAMMLVGLMIVGAEVRRRRGWDKRG